MLQRVLSNRIVSAKAGQAQGTLRPLHTLQHGARLNVVTCAEKPGPSSNGGPAAPGEDLPPWVRREKERELQAKQAASGTQRLPWGAALLGSVLVSIAATGSIFEYIDRNPIFGAIQPDSPIWAPILLFMAVTGYPLAGFLFKYGVDGFNEMAEDQDRMDGYLPNDRK